MKATHPLLLSCALALLGFSVSAQVQEKSEAGQQKGDQPAGAQAGQPPQGQDTGHVVPGSPFEEGGENSWFEKTRKHLGTYYGEEEAVGTFKFKNPNKETKKFTKLEASCQCAKAMFYVGDRVYSLGKEPVANSIHRILKGADGKEEKERVTFITIHPEETGKIEVHLTMGGIQGEKEASLEIQTDDEKLPSSRLQFRAMGAVYFNIDPPDINLNELTWQDHREFSYVVTSPLKPDFNLLALESHPPRCDVKFEKTTKDGKNSWKVSCKYGPNLEEKDGGGEISFKTDANNKSVKMRFAAMVRGPLKMEPTGFASFGAVKRGTEGKLQIYLYPTDDFALQVTKVEFKDLSVDPKFVNVETLTKVPYKDPISKEDRKNVAEVVLTIAKDAPKSTIRGTVKIMTNHPQVPQRELEFNGFVR